MRETKPREINPGLACDISVREVYFEISAFGSGREGTRESEGERVRERGREKEREGGRERGREREGEGGRESEEEREKEREKERGR